MSNDKLFFCVVILATWVGWLLALISRLHKRVTRLENENIKRKSSPRKFTARDDGAQP